MQRKNVVMRSAFARFASKAMPRTAGAKRIVRAVRKSLGWDQPRTRGGKRKHG